MLKGQYAFLVQGFDNASEGEVAVIGSFVADGNGNIITGLENVNGPAVFFRPLRSPVPILSPMVAAKSPSPIHWVRPNYLASPQVVSAAAWPLPGE